MRVAAVLALLALGVAGTALFACGRDEPREVAPPPAPPMRDVTPTTSAAGLPPDAPKAVTFHQITLIYRVPRGDPPRTREQAYKLAKALIDEAKTGTSFGLLINKYTDDRDEGGHPFNRGSYTLAQDSSAMPVVKRAVFTAPVGQVLAEPVDTQIAFLVIWRD